jgi:hypothetical protein
MMERDHVSSSCLKSVGYDDTLQTLEIEFRTKKIYQYYEVPQLVYRALMETDSHGTFFNKHIKGLYKYKRQ